jgi:T-complex protein 1 subunit eta
MKNVYDCMIKATYVTLYGCSFPGGTWYGVDITAEDIADNFEACVWEPALVKINALTAASEATCLILSVDETIRNPKSGAGDGQAPMGRGRGRPR